MKANVLDYVHKDFLWIMIQKDVKLLVQMVLHNQLQGIVLRDVLVLQILMDILIQMELKLVNINVYQILRIYILKIELISVYLLVLIQCFQIL